MASKFVFAENLSTYGSCKFKGAEADKYLTKQGLPKDILSDKSWTQDEATADKVANALLEWAQAHGATMVTHIFQPLGSTSMRLGQTGQVHNSMFNFKQDGTLGWAFDGDKLLHGETDGSSYMNGGLRSTHVAGGCAAPLALPRVSRASEDQSEALASVRFS